MLNQRRAPLKIVVLVVSVLKLTATFCFADEAKTIDNPKYLLYIPSNLDYKTKHPLVLAFSSDADAQRMIEVWKNVAEKYKWLILASKEHRSGTNMQSFSRRFIRMLGEICSSYPVDASKVIAAGFGSGGMMTHALTFYFPAAVSAVVVNTCMIDEYFYNPTNKYWYPRAKIAVFLVSPADFRYKEMLHDWNFLKEHNWETKWIEFEGGHRIAPDSAYQQAAQWLEEKFKE